MKNIYIRSTASVLLILWVMGCAFIPSPRVDSVPWRSEISQQGCPDISGRYKDPEDVVFDAFYAKHSRNASITNNIISWNGYAKYPYNSLSGREYFMEKNIFDKENEIDIRVEGSIITLRKFNKNILYSETKRNEN